LISYASINNNAYKFNLFNQILNGICYLTIIILFSWDKIYYIITKKGNNSEYYFYSLKMDDFPSLQKLYYCGYTKNEREVIKRYIDFYKYTSQIIKITNGRVKYIKKRNKNSYRFSTNYDS
ncbi:hypothetical protein BCR36DRAFT_294518, partial [Piromyces finnis]